MAVSVSNSMTAVITSTLTAAHAAVGATTTTAALREGSLTQAVAVVSALKDTVHLGSH